MGFANERMHTIDFSLEYKLSHKTPRSLTYSVRECLQLSVFCNFIAYVNTHCGIALFNLIRWWWISKMNCMTLLSLSMENRWFSKEIKAFCSREEIWCISRNWRTTKHYDWKTCNYVLPSQIIYARDWCASFNPNQTFKERWFYSPTFKHLLWQVQLLGMLNMPIFIYVIWYL